MKTLLALLAFAFPALGADISGYVYMRDGRVVEGKVVQAGDKSATTDKDGAFTIRDVEPGVVELQVESTATLALTGDVVTITLGSGAVGFSPPIGGLKPAAPPRISGKVTLDGKPLANCPVVVQPLGELETTAMRVLSNAKGEYIAGGLAAMLYAIRLDDRLLPRVRWKGYPTEASIVDLRETSEGSVDIALISAPMIRGRVVDAKGKAVARASVSLTVTQPLTDWDMERRIVRTMPDGRFVLAAPEWSDKAAVQVLVDPLLQSPMRSKVFRVSEANREILIELPKLETVRVRVVDEAGKPIPDARVSYQLSDSVGPFDTGSVLSNAVPEWAPRTNEEGEVVLQLASDSYDFAASAEGYRTASLDLKEIVRPMVLPITLQRAATLRGRVHCNGRGVIGAIVSLSGENAFEMNVRTDANGKFVIHELEPGLQRVTIIKREEMIGRVVDVEVPDEIDVALPEAGTLHGQVIDAVSGEPVDDFSYSVYPTDPDALTGDEYRDETDGNTFTMHIQPGTYRVAAAASGYVALQPIEVRVVSGETTTVHFPLPHGAVVSGSVTDERGVPIEQAAVVIESTQPQTSIQSQRDVQPVHTDANGAFEVRGVERGPAALVVLRDGFLSHRQTIDIEGSMALEIRLMRGLSIQGIVTMDGKPVANASVSATTSAVGAGSPMGSTDDEGRFTITGLMHARYTIGVYHMDRVAEVRDVDPMRQKEVAISLDPKPTAVVFGTVAGIPPALTGMYSRRVVNVAGPEGNAEGLIDDDGSYRIANAPTGEVTIIAYVETSTREGRSSIPKKVDLVAGQQLRVDLDAGSGVRVRGRVTKDGRPVPNALVGFTTRSGVAAVTQAREDGTYEVSLATAGLYLIVARENLTSTGRNYAAREIRAGEIIDIDLSERLIEGTVLDAVTRQPIADAYVALTMGENMPEIRTETATDASGRFRIAATAGGGNRLIASAPGYAHRTQPLGDATQYLFELTPVASLAVRVIDSRTGAALEAQVTISDELGSVPVRERVDANGVYSFSLAPGKYRVTVILHGFSTKVVEVVAPGTVDVLME